MESSDRGPLDLSYMIAALVEERGGELVVSTEWFSSPDNPFEGKQLKMDEIGGLIRITLVDMEKE